MRLVERCHKIFRHVGFHGLSGAVGGRATAVHPTEPRQRGQWVVRFPLSATHKSHLREEKRSSLEDLMSGKHKVESESWNAIIGTSAKFDVARCY